MADLASALGLHQLKKLDSFISRLTHLAQLYNETFTGLAGLKRPSVTPEVKSAWHLYPVQIMSPSPARNDLVGELRKRNIGCNIHFIPLHVVSLYRRTFGYWHGDFPVAEQVFKRIVSLPLFPRVKSNNVMRVAEVAWSIVGSALRSDRSRPQHTRHSWPGLLYATSIIFALTITI